MGKDGRQASEWETVAEREVELVGRKEYGCREWAKQTMASR
jgi:hypothetical protein